uniref:Uncharacterized protein n=1 Tax=Lactuca sativa TaxID=4236 RepID=A0A9R1XK73_LACSA|nr:hypothetical protein LSAT_V11C400167430 [Lactuca sativa]
MTTSSSRSSFNGGTRMRNKKVIRCYCGDSHEHLIIQDENFGAALIIRWKEATVVKISRCVIQGDQAIVRSDHRVVNGYIADARNSGY